MGHSLQCPSRVSSGCWASGSPRLEAEGGVGCWAASCFTPPAGAFLGGMLATGWDAGNWAGGGPGDGSGVCAGSGTLALGLPAHGPCDALGA